MSKKGNPSGKNWGRSPRRSDSEFNKKRGEVTGRFTDTGLRKGVVRNRLSGWGTAPTRSPQDQVQSPGRRPMKHSSSEEQRPKGWAAIESLIGAVEAKTERSEVPETTLTITLSEEQLAQLQEVAARLEVSPEELASIGIEELLTRLDDSFQQAVSYVLKKNTKLYQQLS